MVTISKCLHLKVNFKKNIYLYVNSTIYWCPDKIFKTFLIEDFFPFASVPTTLVIHLELRISPQIFEKNRTILMGYLGAWGKLIRDKT
jgi:hypothetical protein